MTNITQPLIKKRNPYKLSSFYRKYPLNQEDHSNDDGQSLNKCLSILDIISYGIGSTVGAGVFVSIGIAINVYAGPATLLSFLFSAIACLISAFCYSEFSARIPVSGSAYTFAYVSLGEYMGWFVGWNLTLEYAISASAVARGWVGYFGVIFQIFGKDVPTWISGFEINEWISFAPLAPAIIVACTIILVFGIKDSARFNMFITGLNIATILFFIILGSIYVDRANWNPFFTNGINGVFNACSVVFFSYVGFDSVTTLAGEVKNPKRDLPLGIIGTLIVATTLYIAVTLVLSGMVQSDLISQTSPLSQAFLSGGRHMKWAAMIIALGTLTSLTASTLCSLLGQPRIYLQMAKDGLFFQKFTSLNKKQVPVFGTVFTGVFASLLAVFLNLSSLTNMISIGTLLAFTSVCAGVVVMRFRVITNTETGKIPTVVYLIALFAFACVFGISSANSWNKWLQIGFATPLVVIMVLLCLRKQVNIPTSFKCPGNPVVPCLGIIVNTYFIMHLDYASFIRVAVWTALGTIIYLAFGIRYSKLNDLEEKEQDATYPDKITYNQTINF
ncbi:hypothetical protein DICPUDRAFT_57548 [Dictyostelium purpureum]|uniref:Cationic amino acid transporter C-terminal domain-containing protein n=1 Tax=Dictyostelium purpureum TaxID=5786 RepID=F0ZWH0_DICPU|nr:uncharacterized protein DICPUDRAFT_57548 [Dictyostelium purpureum]EGC31696.1 hypothetical protein DICPUDRAFT_57548 [Dictyostelium purpureum]|eukprot:XP_003291762.1 hypothetical protein DICPUDRAFT_57548 [Dictyostelium purpureum]